MPVWSLVRRHVSLIYIEQNGMNGRVASTTCCHSSSPRSAAARFASFNIAPRGARALLSGKCFHIRARGCAWVASRVPHASAAAHFSTSLFCCGSWLRTMPKSHHLCLCTSALISSTPLFACCTRRRLLFFFVTCCDDRLRHHHLRTTLLPCCISALARRSRTFFAWHRAPQNFR